MGRIRVQKRTLGFTDNNITLLFTLLPWAMSLLAGCGSGSGVSNTVDRHAAEVGSAITQAQSRFNQPALVGAIVTSSTIKLNVVGVRKVGSSSPAALVDSFHIGSNAKAFTSTLLAICVEEGKVRWNSPLKECFPELSATMRPEYRDVTLETVLQMRAGIVALFDFAALMQVPPFTGTPREQRGAFVAWALQQAPEAAIGSFRYSNGSYLLAAALIEKLTGQPWETVLQNRLFRPLGITSVLFGLPSAGAASQPWGHSADGNGSYTALDADQVNAQVPAYLGPAGNIAISILDYARFVQMNLRGLRGQTTLIKPDSMKRLHSPPAGSAFALGWDTATIDGVPSSLYIGSLIGFMADVQLQPSRDIAVIAISNADDSAALNACEQSLAQMRGGSQTLSSVTK